METQALSKVVRVDSEKCVNCHACITVCPVKYCNDGSGDSVQVNPDMCIGCGACVVACTHGARVVKRDTEDFLQDLSAGEDIVAIVAPSAAATFGGNLLQLNTWLRQIGIRAVFDVSFGAELTVMSYLEHVSKAKPESLIAQPCPAIVTYAQVHCPSLLEFLAPLDSPMGHTMKMIQRFFPEYAGCKIAAISPCPAKRREFDSTGMGDYNVLFTDILSELQSREVNLASLAETPFDGPQAREAVLFSSPGGLMRTVRGWSGLGQELNIRKIEGMEHVYTYLNALPEQIAKGNAPDLVDCLNCARGCNGGIGTPYHKGNFDQLESAIERRCKSQCEVQPGDRSAFEKRVRQYWEPGLYNRSYADLSANNTCKSPSPEEIEAAYKLMHKNGPEDILNCSSCGYGSCEGMAKAITNGLNRPHNCHHYQELLIRKNLEELSAAEHELREHRDHLEDLVQERTTALESINQSLRESEQHVRTMFDSVKAGIILVDVETRAVMDINPVALTMFGGERDAVIGRLCSESVCHAREGGCPVLDQHQTMDNREDVLVRRDGSTMPVLKTCVPIQYGGKSYLLESFVDLTEQKQMEDDLRKSMDAAASANRAKSDFLARMSHEIRTPMNGVIGMLDLLGGTRMDDRQTRYMRVAKASAESLLGLINDILDLSKIEAQKMELDIVEMDLWEVVEEVCLMLAGRANEKGVELTCRIDPAIPHSVRGDSQRIRQVLTNLVGNAIKFTAEGAVNLKVDRKPESEDGCALHVSVADTGIGISPEDQQKLFQTFSQVDGGISRKYGGSGLGLVISQKLVEMMEGRIAVDSVQGEGTTFWFEIKLPLGASSETKPISKRLMARPLRILVVDDNDVNLEILHTQLAHWGFQVETANNGPQAIKRLYKAARNGLKYDLGIFDMQMPEMSGLELAHNIKSSGRVKQFPLLLLSSMADQISNKELNENGFNGYLAKPVRQSELLDAIIGTIPDNFTQPDLLTANPGDTPPEEQVERRGEMRILVAEDNEINQEVIREILQTSGYVCEIVSDGVEAVRIASRGQCDMVLMDCQMPTMDGLTATRKIRQMEQDGEMSETASAHLTIIALTANAIGGDREKCIEAGMDDYLSKPIDPTALMSKLDSRIAAILDERGKAAPQATGAAPTGETPSSDTTGGQAPAQSRKTQESGSASTAPMAYGNDSAPCPLDMESALERCLGKRDFLDRLMVKFADKLHKDLEAIMQHFQDADPQKIAFVAHGLKGASANLSATRLRQTALRLEQAAKAADFAEIEIAVEQLRHEAQACIVFVNQQTASRA